MKYLKLFVELFLNRTKRTFIKFLLFKSKGTSLKFLGLQVIVPDYQSFVWQYKEIFYDEIYNFSTGGNEPVIVDCGANIGISGLYFKRLYPKSSLHVIEADPDIAKYLESNFKNNSLQYTEFIQKAAWINDEGVSFMSDGADGGSISTGISSQKIESFDFWAYLDSLSSVDFLKMDIEGAEVELFRNHSGQLKKVENLFLEYHSYTNSSQDLSFILSVLEEFGFRYYLDAVQKRKRPFKNRKTDELMDFQVNIFAYKI